MAITPETATKSAATYNCCHCGESKKSTQYYKSYSNLYASTGHLPICKKCLSEVFNKYIEKYGDQKEALRRICMAFDLYYRESLFNSCLNKGGSVLGLYIKGLNMMQCQGKTFDTSIEEGFVLIGDGTSTENNPKEQKKLEPKSENQEESDSKISKRDIKKWGADFEEKDYQALNAHYEQLKNANPNCDSNQEVFIIDLCYINMQKMKSLQKGDIDSYNKLTESYRKSFKQAGLKTEEEAQNNADACWGLLIKDVSQYTVEEYYRDKQLYKDMDGLGEYYDRYCARPLFNTKFGTQERDNEYFVHEEDEDDDES